MKQLEVTIMGQSYVLGCPDGHETELLEAVGNVDREMCNIRDAGKVKSRERMAVLAALNLAYTLAGSHPETRPTHAVTVATGELSPPAQPAYGFDVDALVQRLDAALGDEGHPV